MNSNQKNAFSESESITQIVDEGSHKFIIRGYSLLKGLGSGKSIASNRFKIGGYSWEIYFYPDKNLACNDSNYFSASVGLKGGPKRKVRALLQMELLDQSGKEKHHVILPSSDKLDEALEWKKGGQKWGFSFKKKDLENSDHLKDDCLAIFCTLRIVRTHGTGGCCTCMSF